ncbi:hypothetical protein VI817_003318 [Penicillium citrinum]|nr:hypothetical protein VI817_003318 [Penicillium citrinum]
MDSVVEIMTHSRGSRTPWEDEFGLLVVIDIPLPVAEQGDEAVGVGTETFFKVSGKPIAELSDQCLHLSSCLITHQGLYKWPGKMLARWY